MDQGLLTGSCHNLRYTYNSYSTAITASIKREKKSPSRDPMVTFCQRYELKEDNPTFKSSCCINSSFY
uniref:Uncharacterized protein n=1 Tax=Populus trichocarpa TaxID=3694 RepID=A0A2K2AIA4_POPTR